jgi:hypothetical protein
MKAVLQSSLNLVEKSEFECSIFYKKHYLSSFNFTSSSLAYYQTYFGEDFIDKSIVVYDDSAPVLAMVAYAAKDKLTHFGGPITIIEGVFESAEKKQQAYRLLIQKLNELVKKDAIEEIYFYANEFINAEYFSKIEEVEVEFSSVIDLNISEDLIKMNIRKSYKSLVNWGKNNLELDIIKKDNASLEKFNTFRDFHIKVAGQRTRSDETWQKQYEAILLEEAFLVMGYLQGQLVSCSYIMLGKEIAYYGVGVYDRELMEQNLPIAHYNILTAINLAKSWGCIKFDLGFINNGNQNAKETNIFKFKAGFSNQLIFKNKFIVKFPKSSEQ